jgi:hypothetical protein
VALPWSPQLECEGEGPEAVAWKGAIRTQRLSSVRVTAIYSILDAISEMIHTPRARSVIPVRRLAPGASLPRSLCEPSRSKQGVQLIKKTAAQVVLPALAVFAVLAVSLLAPSRFLGILVASCSPYTYGTPVVTGVSPNVGGTAGGTSVTITGSGFCNNLSSVQFGSTVAASPVLVDDSHITAASPAHAAGTVDVTVTTAAGTSAATPADHFTYVSTPMPCTSLSVSAAPPSPSAPGTTVTFTAVASGCSNPSYQFWILAPGATSWALAQAYSTSATFTWDTTGKPVGTYGISVWARDATSAGTSSNGSGSWDAYNSSQYTLAVPNPTPCTGVGVTSSPSGTAAVGTTVTFTASATGCPHPSYEFWYLQPGSSSWTLGQAYSTSAVFNWSTAGQPAGTFGISVRARDASSAGTSSNGSGSWDTYNSSTYVLTTTHPPCTGVSLASSPSGTAQSGATVTFTATASGCPNPAPVYQFWLLSPGASSYTLAQAYSPSAVFSWNTTGLVAGTYYISVRVRDAMSPGVQGNPSGTWDAYSTVSYVLTVTPCSAVSVTSSPSGTAMAGTSVTFTATGTCPHPAPVYEFWILAPGASSYTLARAYSAVNTFAWNTAGLVAGTYYVSVWVRDANSAGASGNANGSWDAYNTSAYTLTTTPCASVSVTSSPSGSAASGTTVTFTATAMGCPHAAPLYEFWILDPGASSWTKVQAYSTTNTFSWVTTGKPAGTYGVSVRVRDAQSTGTSGNPSGTWDAYNSSTYTLT